MRERGQVGGRHQQVGKVSLGLRHGTVNTRLIGAGFARNRYGRFTAPNNSAERGCRPAEGTQGWMRYHRVSLLHALQDEEDGTAPVFGLELLRPLTRGVVLVANGERVLLHLVNAGDGTFLAAFNPGEVNRRRFSRT